MRLHYSICGIILSFLYSIGGISQDYLKTLEEPDKYLHQKIVRFPNGDILIGDSSTEALNSGGNGKILLTRMDNCGQVEWSYSYETIGLYIEFRDFKINAQSEIIVYGSAYKGFDERIFLLKVLPNGSIRRFLLFNTGTVDHFTYNLDLKNGQVLAYGLLLDWNVQKQGFVALFDEDLNYQWGKRFTPFDTGGEAIILEDGGFLGRSGSYLYKLDKHGALDWASINTSITSSTPIAGPIAVEGGYVFESSQEEESFFFKLDKSGHLIWTSSKFPSTQAAAAIKMQPDGNLLAVYSSPGTNENYLCYLLLAPTGEILRQRQLQTDLSFRTGDTDHTLSDDGILTIAGNAAGATNANQVGDFLLQFSLDGEGNDCFYWEDIQATLPNHANLTFIPLDTIIRDLNMSLFQEEIQLEKATIKTPLFQNQCDQAPHGNQVQVDTLLKCGENWLVSLPSSDFIWLDNALSTPRLLDQEGAYRASNRNCVQPITYTYTLEREACKCAVFLPNALSPNNDSYNDGLSLYSNCTLTAMTMKVYSRWGDLLFESRNTNNFWDGKSKGQVVPPGLYVVTVSYQLVDEVGEVQTGEIAQEVLVLR
ncbi:MAG: gliding motility-associated C-terminal domain-containing protein [Saprospiraceae bacterium]